jgi:hypothetical protein
MSTPHSSDQLVPLALLNAVDATSAPRPARRWPLRAAVFVAVGLAVAGWRASWRPDDDTAVQERPAGHVGEVHDRPPARAPRTRPLSRRASPKATRPRTPGRKPKARRPTSTPTPAAPPAPAVRALPDIASPSAPPTARPSGFDQEFF